MNKIINIDIGLIDSHEKIGLEKPTTSLGSLE